MPTVGTGPLSVRSRRLESGLSLKPRPELLLAEGLLVLLVLLVLRLMLELNLRHSTELCLGVDLIFVKTQRALLWMSAAEALARRIANHSTKQALSRRRSTPAAS